MGSHTQLLGIQASEVSEQAGWWGPREGGVNLPNLKRDSLYTTKLLLSRKMYPVWPEFLNFREKPEI